MAYENTWQQCGSKLREVKQLVRKVWSETEEGSRGTEGGEGRD